MKKVSPRNKRWRFCEAETPSINVYKKNIVSGRPFLKTCLTSNMNTEKMEQPWYIKTTSASSRDISRYNPNVYYKCLPPLDIALEANPRHTFENWRFSRISGLLANFDVIFRGQGVEIGQKWYRCIRNANSRAVQICNQVLCSSYRCWDMPRWRNITF